MILARADLLIKCDYISIEMKIKYWWEDSLDSYAIPILPFRLAIHPPPLCPLLIVLINLIVSSQVCVCVSSDNGTGRV